MTEESGTKARSRWTYLDGSIRLVDTSNSRMALEIDLGRLPWDPFNALGKKVTVLVPVPPGWEEAPGEEEDQLDRAHRFVTHAAERSKEFAEAGNGDQSDWWAAFQTWDWLQKLLTVKMAEASLSALDGGSGLGEDTAAGAFPSLPGAASILGYTLGAIRSIPLDQWEKSVSTLDPEAPSREEAIQTILALSKLLKGGQPGEAASDEGSAATGEAEDASEGRGGTADSVDGSPPPPEEDELSFDYAQGFDEGYSMGRRVGFALGSHHRRRSEGSP